MANKRINLDEPKNGNGDAPVIDLESKRKELTEAMKGDMEVRAAKAREEIEAILKKHRCAIMAMPRFQHMEKGVFAVMCDPLIQALE